ncbi:hypothetical protein TNIN_95051 [Trichonephila inaurata madagascariensis]|uniref:Uncharacterized protein n=1 Tax=Trichonephila inaurata madagascariensis TaxID=2747483 RepID=A0A8X6XDI2_9ARAC|nr:hypothetical protein TNIN_95051 [Trichonephila inaurata madagascariensis]
MGVASGNYGHLLIPIMLKQLPHDLVVEFHRQKDSKNLVDDKELMRNSLNLNLNLASRQTLYLDIHKKSQKILDILREIYLISDNNLNSNIIFLHLPL